MVIARVDVAAERSAALVVVDILSLSRLCFLDKFVFAVPVVRTESVADWSTRPTVRNC